MKLIRIVSYLLAMSSAVPLAFSQTDRGLIQGTVTDSSGAPIPGASVSVKSEKTGEERTAKSSDSGVYIVTNLPAASYTVSGKTADLGPAQYTNIRLTVGQERV